MEPTLAMLDAQPLMLEEPAPGLDQVVEEIGISERLVNFVADADEERDTTEVHCERLDEAIFLALLTP